MSEGQVKNASKLLGEASKNSKNKEKVLDALLAAVDTAESAGLQGAEGIAKDDPAMEGKVKEFQEVTSDTANRAREKIAKLRTSGPEGPETHKDGWESSAELSPMMHHGRFGHRGPLSALHGMTNSLMGHVVNATTQINNPAQLKIILGIIQLLIRQVNTLTTRMNDLGKRMGSLEGKLKLPLTPFPNIPLLSEQHAPHYAYERGSLTAPEVSRSSSPAPEATPKSNSAALKGSSTTPKGNSKNNAATPNSKPAVNDSKGKPANNKPKQGNAKPAAKLTRRNRSQRRFLRSRRQRR